MIFEGWPARLLIVRHGESAGNVARERALAQQLPEINLAERDCDVRLSRLGQRQSQALGEWLRDNEAPADVVFTSPYARAQETTRLVLASAGWSDAQVTIDERVREKEFGILDRLTRAGIAQKYPEQAAMLASLGKFYHRPPGGESWTDVILRLRSVVDTLTREWADKRCS